MSHQRTDSVSSLDDDGSEDTHIQMSTEDEHDFSRETEARDPRTPSNHQGVRSHRAHQSQQLPYWLWFIIAKSLGIKLYEAEKPIFATVLYVLTFSSALAYATSNWWFTTCDIVSDYTKTTVIDGAVGIAFIILWGAQGLYANKLAYRLFTNAKFHSMLRLHSKTILKMNAAAVLFCIMLLMIIVNDVSGFSNFKDEACEIVSVAILVCKVRYLSRVLYSVFALLWNYLVAFVIISVCRTHTIDIRKFMQVLEQDATACELHYTGLSQRITEQRAPLEEYTWVDENYLEELKEGEEVEVGAVTSSALSPQVSASTSGIASSTSATLPVQFASPSSSFGSQPAASQAYPIMSHTKSTAGISSLQKHILSTHEILFQFWKLQTFLRISSVALQRWMMSLICLVAIWMAMNLVLWLSYNPTLIDLSNFILPVLLLPLISSAYAEVNQEGIRLLKFICPLEERLHMLHVLQNVPLQMTVYGFPIAYSSITTAAFGLLVAIISKILLQEISGAGL